MLNEWLAVLTFILILSSFLCLAVKNLRVWVIIQALIGFMGAYTSLNNNDMSSAFISIATMYVILFSYSDGLDLDITANNYHSVRLLVIYLIVTVVAICISHSSTNPTAIMQYAISTLPLLFISMLNYKIYLGWIVAYMYYMILSVLWITEYTFKYSLIFTSMNAILAGVCIYGFYRWYKYEKEMVV